MAGFSTFSLDSFGGEWTFQEAAHLLRRAKYAPSKQEIDEAVGMGLDALMDQLIEVTPLPDPPLNYNFELDSTTPIGESWVGKPYIRSDEFNPNLLINARVRSLRAWTMGQAISEGSTMREKMTLFWHNHFVVGDERDSNFSFRNIALYRENFLGNFREITKQTVIDPAMLRYLNGSQNTNGRPNENFARELLELFTIGKGPLAGEGDYTNYTELDVAEVAKVMTGWKDRGYFNRGGEETGSFFRSFAHDKSTKTLSHRFGSVEIPDMGEEEYKHLIDIIFQQEEVANFIARKIYRWFVYYDISDEVEQSIIQPMAQILRDNDYEMKPMVKALISSQHFFDEYAQGSQIKNPLDFIVGLLKNLEVDLGDDFQLEYAVWFRISNFAELLQMAYFSPPNVAGWKAYYQEPLYYRTWLNTSTLTSRYALTTLLLNGIRAGDFRIEASVIDMVGGVEGANDPNTLIESLSSIYLPKAISEGQLEYLKSILIPGLPDFEWTVEYDQFLANPDDEELKAAVENRLKAMVLGLLSLPEYQLS